MSEGLDVQIPAPPAPVDESPSPEPRDPWWSGASWAAALGALAFGLAADVLLRGPVGAGLFALCVTATVVAVAVHRPRRVAIPFFVAAPTLAGFDVIRVSPALVTLDIATSIGLLAIGAAFSREGQPFATTFRGYVVRTLSIFGSLPEGVVSPLAPFGRAASKKRQVRHLSRTVIIVVPVVAIFITLLGSADAVFAHYVKAWLGAVPPTRGLPGHLVVIALGAVALSTVLARCAMPVHLSADHSSPRTGFTLRRGEWVLLLGAVDAVFAAFVLVQLTYFFGGKALVLHQEGLTFAQYARTGFAQLLVAALLTTALIAAVWKVGVRDAKHDGRLFSWLAGSLVVLTMVVLESANRRLVLYEGAFGWTWPRLLGHATVVFVALSLVCGLVWILRRRGKWLATAVLVMGLVTLLALNVMDPDRFIAQRNIARFNTTGVLDTGELSGLSVDAAPTIVMALPSLPVPERAVLAHHLACQREELETQQAGMGSWDLARSRALSVLAGADLGGC